MAFVSGYKHDIFVSYGHVDNQLSSGAKEGWVTTLVGNLSIALSERLGRTDAFSLWMDLQLPGNKPLTPEILNEHLQQSALLLIVLSPSYLSSDWCGQEMQAFLDIVQTSPHNRSRIFVVERLEVERNRLPAALADLLGYKFWEHDNAKNAHPLSVTYPEFQQALYNQQCVKLANELVKELYAMQASPQVLSDPKVSLSSSQQRQYSKTPVITRSDRAIGHVEPLPLDLRNPESAVGLFVGIGQFDERSYLSRLRYAADDAVALAHLFVIELQLIHPQHVQIALSGGPMSTQAQQWLSALQEAAVTLIPATRTELLYAVHALADRGNEANGLVMMTFSTHGCVEQGNAYLMPADGARRFTAETGLPLDLIYTIFRALESPKKLLIVDACRMSGEGGMRGNETMSDEFQQVLKKAQGLAVLSACDVGQSSWESPQLAQGVFTHFLLQGLRGDATARFEDGLICLENVFAYALARTNTFVRQNIKVEQLPWYGGEAVMRALPLAVSPLQKQQVEQRKQHLRELHERKDIALRCLSEARLARDNRGVISLQLQEEVEKELEILEGEPLNELLDSLEKLADRKTASCKMFVAWWKEGHAMAVARPVIRPHLHTPWENTLGMRFTPVGNSLFGVWQTRVQDFREFASDTRHSATDGHFYSLDEEGKWREQGHTWMEPGYEQGPTHPVVGITWEDAVAFCQWLTQKEQQEGYLTSRQLYRLPSDEEWSQAVGVAKYPWGDVWPPPPAVGNYALRQPQAAPSSLIGNLTASQLEVSPGTSPVGSFSPNRFGIYDLGGNVWEWCHDWYTKEMNPLELRELYTFLDDDGGGMSYHFLRGGSWYNKESHELRSAYRNPGKYPDARFANVGFRCVLDMGQSSLFEEPHV